MPEPQRGRAFDRAERKFDLMPALGTDLMLICSNVSPASLGGIGRAASDFRELGERAAKRGLRVAYEALAWGRHVNDHRDAWEIVRRADHPNVGLVLDSFHTLARGIDPETIRSIPGDRIFLVQIADAPKLDMDYLSWSRHFRNMPGQGALAVNQFLAAVDATGYDGYLSLEIFNDQFRAGSARMVAVDGRRSLLAAMDTVRNAQTPPAAARDWKPLPPKARCLGVEFIEFAVDDSGAVELAKLFQAMGFAHAGQHVSKDVAWWRQGGINFVINAEKEGFAHASYLTHGPSVCAIALDVGDAGAATARAEALLAKPFAQQTGPDELAIPAIRGVGGSLLYFIDRPSGLARLWEIDFQPAAAAPPPPLTSMSSPEKAPRLTRVDHISQSMEYDEMLSWLLFYISIFEMERTPQVDVADPGGLVRSQAVQTAGGDARIVLNGADNSRTSSGRFLREFFGSGVQHIALATDDALATAQAFDAAGVARLHIPDNYYDDLEARFPLEPEFVNRLKAAHVLYDRDDAGEYLQLYTQPFAGRFFFEIVERRKAYNGFGAANASIRLAVQSRESRPGML